MMRGGQEQSREKKKKEDKPVRDLLVATLT